MSAEGFRKVSITEEKTCLRQGCHVVGMEKAVIGIKVKKLLHGELGSPGITAHQWILCIIVIPHFFVGLLGTVYFSPPQTRSSSPRAGTRYVSV